MPEPKYPDVHVQLSGNDGNAFAILSRCGKAARRAKVPQEEVDRFMEEATSGDYDDLLVTCTKWFDIS